MISNKFTKIFIYAVLIILFCVFIYKSNNIAKKGIINKNDKKITGVKPKEIFCSRKLRLDNQPQYDRALSLIQQRLITNKKRFKYNNRAIFTYFPSDLVNCIKIIEEAPNDKNDFEGYFKFNGSKIKENYYPIVVNSKYVESDDVLIALLLSHEMTHVQQYINSVNNKKAFSCIDNEVDAFLASRQFYISGLNNEEMSVVSLRINETIDNDRIDPRSFDNQLIMLNVIQNLYSSPQSKCKKVNVSSDEWNESINCIDKEVPVLLKQIIENDDYYKKQCNL